MKVKLEVMGDRVEVPFLSWFYDYSKSFNLKQRKSFSEDFYDLKILAWLSRLLLRTNLNVMGQALCLVGLLSYSINGSSQKTIKIQ